MKKISAFFTVVIIGLLLATSVQAQNKKDYFAGNWKVVVKGLPSGEETASLLFVRNNGKLEGTIHRENGEVIKLTHVQEKTDTLSGYFFAEGYDLDLFLAKKDLKTFTGSVMGSYPLEGTRVIPDTKKK